MALTLKRLLPHRVRVAVSRALGRSKSLLSPRRIMFHSSDPSVLNCMIAYNDYGGYCVPCSSSHRIAAQTVFAGDVWEPDTLEFIEQRLGEGDLVHAGTYFGDFLPRVSRACADGALVWAFEPNPENFRCAEITALINDLRNVRLTHAGLGEKGSEKCMTVADEDGKALGGASRLTDREVSGELVERVSVVSLDELYPEDRRVGIIQLDVEGFEQQALTGAMKTIERCRPVIILEGLPTGRWLRDNLLSIGYSETHRLHVNTVFESTP